MKKYSYFFLGFVVFFCLSVSSYSMPIGAEYLVDESNNPLIIKFSNLNGSLEYDLFLKTEPQSDTAAPDAYFTRESSDPDSGDILVQYIEFNESYNDWVRQTITENINGDALIGDKFIRFIVADFDPLSNPVAYVKNFSSPGEYISGGAPVPEPSTIILLSAGIVGLARIRKKKILKK